MKKILILIFFILTLLFPVRVSAQQVNFVWKCLEAKRCWSNKDGEAYKPGDCYSPNAHKAKLFVKDDGLLDKNQDNYIVEVIDTTQGSIYTTGNSQLDLQIFGQDNVAKLRELTYFPEYHGPYDATKSFLFLGLFDKAHGPDNNYPTNYIWGTNSSPANYPLKAGSSYIDSQGKFTPNLEWMSFTPDDLPRQFKVLNLVADLTPVPTLAGNDKSLQQKTITYDEIVKGDETQCVKITWDPFGRVFDSVSLEPVSNARVTLQKKANNSNNFADVSLFDISTIANPYIVKDDGVFSFAVPDGQYKLKVEMPNYEFPNVLSKLNGNYIKAFYEIYRGEIIVQKGKIEHRDIPIDAKNNPISSPVKMMEYSYDLNKKTNTVIIDGRASHPLTKILAYSLKNDTGTNVRYRLLKTIQADKWGKFKLEIDQTVFEQGEFFGEIELEKVNLTTKETEKTKNKILSLSYIPNYLEGYVYDEAGIVIPNATVGVYTTYSNKPYFETKADEKGYFKIYSYNLPFMPYEIRYTSALGKVIKMATEKFLNQNKKYLTSGKISLNNYKTNLITTNKSGDGGFIQNQIGVNKNESSNIPQKAASNNSQLMVPLIILSLLLTGAAIILGFYIYKKNRSGNL